MPYTRRAQENTSLQPKKGKASNRIPQVILHCEKGAIIASDDLLLQAREDAWTTKDEVNVTLQSTCPLLHSPRGTAFSSCVLVSSDSSVCAISTNLIAKLFTAVGVETTTARELRAFTSLR